MPFSGAGRYIQRIQILAVYSIFWLVDVLWHMHSCELFHVKLDLYANTSKATLQILELIYLRTIKWLIVLLTQVMLFFQVQSPAREQFHVLLPCPGP